ncbi:MAG: hypothetical protein DRP09_22045 [Candidatus Thorarchaeota archaeon]|nr:MAG: hypothetical protein DRP09_22045 [Candidatus Thorarchaeota archaeon]
MREERERRKELREENEKLRRMLEEMQKPQEPEEQLNPDEYATVGDVQKILERERQKLAQELQAQQLQQVQYQTKLMAAEIQARQKYPDYDEVIKELQPVLHENETLRQVLLSDPERAPELAYTFAKGLKVQKTSTLEKKETAESLANQQKPPATMTARSAGARKTPVRNVEDMSLDEYARYIESLRPEERDKLIGLA